MDRVSAAFTKQLQRLPACIVIIAYLFGYEVHADMTHMPLRASYERERERERERWSVATALVTYLHISRPPSLSQLNNTHTHKRKQNRRRLLSRVPHPGSSAITSVPAKHPCPAGSPLFESQTRPLPNRQRQPLVRTVPEDPGKAVSYPTLHLSRARQCVDMYTPPPPTARQVHDRGSSVLWSRHRFAGRAVCKQGSWDR
ncbi:hypothetical protein J3F83DRAFT_748673 [Trichoderma novae-zelandiae]